MNLTREELKAAHNNVMVVMENHIMALTGCDRLTANLVTNEVLNLDRDAEYLLNNPKDEDEPSCNTCKYYINSECVLEENGC